MIVGIGTDIIEINRVAKACEKENFIKKVYTDDEIIMSGSRVFMLADNFAVKEAVSKAFGTGVRKFKLRDIEVLRDELGKPYVNLYNGAKKIADECGIDSIFVSISNTKDTSVAFCVACKNE